MPSNPGILKGTLRGLPAVLTLLYDGLKAEPNRRDAGRPMEDIIVNDDGSTDI